jgi:ABC-2 type transport system ATP-binding protein
MQSLTFEDVSLSYRSDAPPALSEVSVMMTPGIIGLVGVNGAGKSSFLRLLLGTRQPTQGRVTIDGLTPETFRRRSAVGFIPEKPMFPVHLTVGEFLTGLREMMGAGGPTEAEESLAAAFDIAALLPIRLGQLSLGQKRRVEVMAALIGDPPLLLLDEPTNGLDPLAVTALRAGVLACKRDDRIIIVSSHHLDELQRIADRVVMLDHGKVVGSWDGHEAREQAGALESRFLSLAGEHAR